MAKARAICTCSTCGATFEITAYRQNSRDARSFEEWAAANIDECPECKEKRISAERKVENAKAAEAANEKGWPKLAGSEKQIAWANTIREAGMSEIIRIIEQMKESLNFDKDAYRISMLAAEKMLENTAASWWIDNRDSLKLSFKLLYIRIRENPAEFAISTTEEAELKDDEATIAEPEKRTHEGIVEITVADKRISAAYRKDDDFRQLVKKLEYRWDNDAKAWYLQIGLYTGPAQERAAELGNKLLNAGFAIRIQDANTLRDAIEGNYEPMAHRWIARKNDGLFITWGYDDDLYSEARRLPGAKYDRPGILVPSRECDAVMDFAQTYGFRLTPGAQEIVNGMAPSRIVNPAAEKNAAYNEHPVTDILNSDRDIIDDLKD